MQIPSIEGAPAADLLRSPAARAVAQLSADSGLLLAHFEHRVHLPLPAEWAPEGRGDLGAAVSGWRAGRLHEPKYRSFQLDRRIGSFHPGHRGKWTAHELCHGLVGFGWASGRSLLWHATAARLSELLPVVLYYFLDEAGLRRCPRHQGDGPLYRSFCADCEAAAAEGPVPDRHAEKWIARGRRFLDRELAAVARTRRLGTVVPHHHATLDLSSDGLAYVAGHAGRLRSEAFARYVGRFFGGGDGWHADLDAMEARVEAVFAHIVGDGTAAPLAGDAVRWKAQDLAWRVMLVQLECEGDVVDALDAHVLTPLEAAASGEAAGLAGAIAGYRALHAEWVLPPISEVFSVGYALPDGLGRSEDQLADGIESALPATWALLGDDASEVAGDFTWEDLPERRPLALRFSDWLSAEDPGSPLADQAAFEAALLTAPATDPAEQTLRGDGLTDQPLRLARGVRYLAPCHAVGADLEAVSEQGLIALDDPLHLLVLRQPDGEVIVLQLSDDAGPAIAALGDGADPLLSLDPSERGELIALGALVPTDWPI